MQIELEAKNKILSEISAIDGLTGISNRRTLTEFLISETAISRRSGRPLSIAIFDIDDFKKVNDSKGHMTGDKVLVETARIITANIRDSDLAGRFGGEEFMVIFPRTDVFSAYNAAERIRNEVGDHLFADGLKITISGGVRQFRGEEMDDFIHAADINLYEAKSKGKNLVIR